jgi:hypothetical protein
MNPQKLSVDFQSAEAIIVKLTFARRGTLFPLTPALSLGRNDAIIFGEHTCPRVFRLAPSPVGETLRPPFCVPRGRGTQHARRVRSPSITALFRLVERKTLAPSLVNYFRLSPTERLRTILPLPEGEGRGEGEQRERIVIDDEYPALGGSSL